MITRYRPEPKMVDFMESKKGTIVFYEDHLAEVTTLRTVIKELEAQVKLGGEMRDVLAGKLAACEQDAERYLWLRDKANGYKYTAPLCWWTDSNGRIGDSVMGVDLDSAVDSAIQQSKSSAQGEK